MKKKQDNLNKKNICWSFSILSGFLCFILFASFGLFSYCSTFSPGALLCFCVHSIIQLIELTCSLFHNYSPLLLYSWLFSVWLLCSLKTSCQVVPLCFCSCVVRYHQRLYCNMILLIYEFGSLSTVKKSLAKKRMHF